MTTISLCMIVKNGERYLEQCLESVHDLVDEVIVVDTGSNDKTKDIVWRFTSKVHDFEWIDDFSAARNFSFSKATKDYILWLDADDVLLEKDRQKFINLKNNIDSSIDVFLFKYNYCHDEYGNVMLSHFRERLLKRSRNFKWFDPIHEYLNVDGKMAIADICVTHKKSHGVTDRNIKIFEKMISEGRVLSPRNIFYYARELYSHERYDEAICYFKKLLDSGNGNIEDNISGCYSLAMCYKHKEDTRNMLDSLYRSFDYAPPRAEFCCELGYYFLKKDDYQNAIFWYKLALEVEKPKNLWGFDIVDCWDYIPCIQLCICYDRLGKIEEAIKYNDLAARCKPDDKYVLQNKKYFKNKAK